MGLLLLTIYVNGKDVDISSRISKFADDTKLYKTVSNVDDHNILQNDLDKLLEWSQKWQMSFNIGKCGVMHAGHQNPLLSYDMDGNCLKSIETEKDLGVTVSSNLRPSTNVEVAVKKANNMLGFIKRTVSNKS